MLLPFLGPDYWRWFLLWWLPPAGSPALTARSQIALIHRNHLPRSGKISLKYIRTQLVTILCSNYSGQRRDHSPRADALRLNPVYLLLRLAHLPNFPSPPRHHHPPQNRHHQVSHAIRNARCPSEVAAIKASRENGTDGGVVAVSSRPGKSRPRMITSLPVSLYSIRWDSSLATPFDCFFFFSPMASLARLRSRLPLETTGRHAVSSLKFLSA